MRHGSGRLAYVGVASFRCRTGNERVDNTLDTFAVFTGRTGDIRREFFLGGRGVKRLGRGMKAVVHIDGCCCFSEAGKRGRVVAGSMPREWRVGYGRCPLTPR